MNASPNDSVRLPRATPFWGPENRLTEWAAAQLLAAFQAPAELPPTNPEIAAPTDPFPLPGLVVWNGPAGAGKTTLARSLLAAFRRACPSLTALEVSGREFGLDLQEALEARDYDAWRETFDRANFVVFDDLLALAGRPGAQREAAHLLDRLLLRGGRAVVTVRRPPAGWRRPASSRHPDPALSPALVSRLRAGLVIGLAPLSGSSRVELFQQLAAERGWTCSPDALAAVEAAALAHPGDVVRLLALLTSRRIAESADSLTARDVEQALAAAPDRAPDAQRILALVAARTGHTVADLRGPSRERGAVAARNLAIWLVRRLAGFTYEQIGRQLGRRDHTTILHALRQAEARFAAYPAERERAALLEEQLREG